VFSAVNLVYHSIVNLKLPVKKYINNDDFVYKEYMQLNHAFMSLNLYNLKHENFCLNVVLTNIWKNK